jgi:hypothetical protein
MGAFIGGIEPETAAARLWAVLAAITDQAKPETT